MKKTNVAVSKGDYFIVHEYRRELCTLIYHNLFYGSKKNEDIANILQDFEADEAGNDEA